MASQFAAGVRREGKRGSGDSEIGAGAMSSVTTAYQQATEDMAGVRLADFAIPGDLGPVWSGSPTTPPSGVASTASPAPVFGSNGGVTPGPGPVPATVPASWLPPAPTEMPFAPAEAAPSAMPSLGSAGPALPGQNLPRRRAKLTKPPWLQPALNKR